jgi:hypothetical protein
MRKAILMLAVMSSACWAQHGGGYVFAGPATFTNSIYTFWEGSRAHVGVGGEAGLGQHVTLGGEVGALLGTGRYSRSAALLSANPAVYFIPASRAPKLDPFVTGGFTVLVRSGVEPMWNVGGGATYWFQRRLGVRFEVRDHIWMRESVSMHLVSFRVGLGFRLR